MASKNPFRNRNQPPPFRRGEFVTPCVGKRSYGKWRHGEFREIHDVIYDDTNDPYGSWVLVIWNPLKSKMPVFLHQCSKYNPANFTKELYLPPSVDHLNCRCFIKEKEPMDQARYISSVETALYLAFSVKRAGPDTAPDFIPFHQTSTTLSDLQKAIEAEIGEGDEVLIVKTVMKIEGLPPRPPIRRTEFR